ncbi:MAG: ribbon-helix-helix domain-containing protein [Gemmatimonadales bacterium]
MQIMTVKLPDDLKKRLEEMAARMEVSRSSLVREALAAYLSEPADAEAGPSVVELAGRAIGRAAGPGLAATDPERMKGYGR